jgi:hypothetical protein
MLMLRTFLQYAAKHRDAQFVRCIDYVRAWRQNRTPSLPVDAGG